jgi:hypothetical protein
MRTAACILSLTWIAGAVAAEAVATTDGEIAGTRIDVKDLKLFTASLLTTELGEMP